VPAAAAASQPLASPGKLKSARQEAAPKRDPFAYDNAYTNFGAHIDVHRWSCVGTPEEVQQYIIGPGRAGTTDENGWTCLHWACYAGETETIRTLEKQGGVDINAQTKTGDTGAAMSRCSRCCWTSAQMEPSRTTAARCHIS
jgi:ankyrin repeat protein